MGKVVAMVTIYDDDPTETVEADVVTVAGRTMLYEIALRGMDLDLYEEARKICHTPQAICDAYGTLHYIRYGHEWEGYQIW